MSDTTGGGHPNARRCTPGFAFISSWYADQCDGEWEHEFGVKIETLDNPGWNVQIDLMDTDIQGCQLKFSRRDLSGGEWVMASSDGARFSTSCSPGAVEEADRAFELFVTDGRPIRANEWMGPLDVRVSALLSMQRALWNLVTPNLRGVAVRVTPVHVEARFLFENEPTDEDVENMSEAETAVMADARSSVAVSFDATWVSNSSPRDLEADEEWVYLRKES